MQTILITGTSSGYGLETARHFLDKGWTVVATMRRPDPGLFPASPRLRLLPLDVTNDENIAATVAAAGPIDVLVNNAGIFQVVGVGDTTLDDWNRMIAINQTGVFLGIREVGCQMCAQGSGSIINISSIAGMASAAIAFAYSASKWAVRGMTKSAAVDFGPHGVRVNSVHPGIIETAMLDEFGELAPVITERIPLGRSASADEVANVVLFLASDESAYCSGHEYLVDGALTA